MIGNQVAGSPDSTHDPETTIVNRPNPHKTIPLIEKAILRERIMVNSTANPARVKPNPNRIDPCFSYVFQASFFQNSPIFNAIANPIAVNTVPTLSAVA